MIFYSIYVILYSVQTIQIKKADYVSMLSAGEHPIGIVSTGGTAATTLPNAKRGKTNEQSEEVHFNCFVGDFCRRFLRLACVLGAVFHQISDHRQH
ncbi:MAG: hypothetical protein MSS92_07965 [Lachnospiraceae bacterium]|nr:hypothetical protein [Lachnospiraceae bacterium]